MDTMDKIIVNALHRGTNIHF